MNLEPLQDISNSYFDHRSQSGCLGADVTLHDKATDKIKPENTTSHEDFENEDENLPDIQDQDNGQVDAQPSWTEMPNSSLAYNSYNIPTLDTSAQNQNYSSENVENEEIEGQFEQCTRAFKANDGTAWSIHSQMTQSLKQTPVRHFNSAHQLGISPIAETERENYSSVGKDDRFVSRGNRKRNFLAYSMSNQKHVRSLSTGKDKGFVSMKNQLEDFFNRRSSDAYSPSAKTRRMKLSVPKSPILHTKERYRTPSDMTTTEDKVMQEIKAYRDKRSKEIEKHSSRTTDNSMSVEFDNKANASNLRNSLSKTTHIQPFDFELEKRTYRKIDSAAIAKQAKIAAAAFKAKPVPTYGSFEIKKSNLPCVIPKEFNLNTDQRGGERRKQLQEVIQKQVKQLREQQKFKATPIPDYTKLAREGMNTNVQPPARTQPVEPKFLTEQRASLRTSISQKSSQEESYKFKAQPIPNLSNPFKPKIERPEHPIEFHEFEFHTTKRMQERQEFEEKVNRKQEQLRKQQEEEKQRKQQEEIKALRSQLIFKAAPIKQYAPVQIKPSDKPLVEPESPKFHIRERKFV